MNMIRPRDAGEAIELTGEPVRARVCFLYVAQSHQVLHSLSAATALARMRPDLTVDVLAASHEVLAYARTVADVTEPAPIGWGLLGPAWLRGIRTREGTPPKLPLLLANARRLGGYDVIVAPERTTAALRWLGVKARLVYTQHGAGDRAGPFEPRLGAFDLVFAAGAKQRDRMVGEGLVPPSRCAVVGYPKFELVDRLNPPLPVLFDQVRPTVLYNPHFSGSLGSWPAWGLQVLEWFAAQDRYNLIFAPHLRLFGGRRPEAIPQLAPFVGHPRIHIDLGQGSSAIDMTYVRTADVYLGDVSSQVYEFLRRPRPCVFLNPAHVAWRGDESYRHWTLGPVVEALDDLPAAIDTAVTGHATYLPAQLANFAATFDPSGSPSLRAAEAIARLATTAARQNRALSAKPAPWLSAQGMKRTESSRGLTNQ